MSDNEPLTDGSPDTATLRRALGCFVTGVTVVTTRDAGGVPLGFTANSFTSVSLDPPLVLVCVGHEVEGLDVYRRCSEFAINVLGESQRVLSDRFATEHPDRFGGVRWRQGAHGAPILEGCVAALECVPWRRIEAGDHMILIGRVLRCEGSGDRPLAYWRGSYRRLPCDRDDIVHEDGSQKPSRSQPRVGERRRFAALAPDPMNHAGRTARR